MFPLLAVLPIVPSLVTLGVAIVVISWLIARNAKRQGHAFGTTFLMTIIGLAGVVVTVLGVFSFLFN